MKDIDDRLNKIYGGKRWILAGGAAVGASRLVEQLQEMGSTVLVVAAVEGVGDLPDTEIVYTRSSADTIVEGIRAFFASVEDPSYEVLAAVDAFDPDRSAQVLAEPFATASTMLHRPTFGVRRPEWSRLEDKLIVDELWDELEVPRAPVRIVAPEDAPAAADEIATHLGTVWVADNSRGWHGGGDFVRWVRDSSDAAEMADWFKGHADLVRVMPFLDGLPCSIHGWVTSSGVAIFSPVEILVVRPETGNQFGYAGVSTTWYPDEEIVDEMRTVARKVGDGLVERVGYIGPYGVDGVLTSDGFRPTELNPRMSVGAGVQMIGAELPLGLTMRAQVEGLLDIDHEWLEELVRSTRPTRLHFGMPLSAAPEVSMRVERGPDGLRPTDDEDSIGEIAIGNSPNGMYMRGPFDPDAVEPGAAAGPLVAEAINLATDTWDLDLPRYRPAVVP